MVEDDCGLAPNPYWEYCTLAVCKPQIRLFANEGDWITGLSPKRDGYRLLYAMKVEEKLPFGEYFRDSRFEDKKPDMTSADPRQIFGDNFYHLNESGDYEQLWSAHSNSDRTEYQPKKENDLYGRNVLTTRIFYYFGENGQAVPGELDFLQVGRGHKNNFSRQEVLNFLRYIEKSEPGIYGQPKDLEKNLRWLSRVWLGRKA